MSDYPKFVWYRLNTGNMACALWFSDACAKREGRTNDVLLSVSLSEREKSLSLSELEKKYPAPHLSLS